MPKHIKGSKKKKFRWYYLYFLFAALDLAIIMVSLNTQHTTLQSFNTLLKESERIFQRQKQIADLRNQLLDLNSYGNNVFEDRDVPKHRMAFGESHRRLDTLIDQTKRFDLDTEPFHHEVEEMEEAAVKIFDLLEDTSGLEKDSRNRETKATAFMALMDQKQVLAMNELAKLQNELQSYTQNILEDELEIFYQQQRSEWYLAIFVFVAIGCILYFGRKMHKTFEAYNTRLLKSEERTRAIFENVVDGIIVISPQGIIQEVNPAACKLFGFSYEEMVWQNVKMLMPDPDKSSHDLYIHRYLKTGERKIIGIGREVLGQKKDGSLFPLELAVSKTEVDGEMLFTGILRDISRRKEDEEKLLKATEQAQDAARTKSSFLANMSHEIRTPMNTILGFTDLLKNTNLNDVQKEYLSVVRSSGDLLLELINDILDFSKFESGQMRLESIDFSLESLLHDVFSMIVPKIGGKDLDTYIQIERNVPNDLKGDPTRLRQIFINLLGNAVKFTEKGEVGVTVHCIEQHDDGHVILKFSVNDTGIGIPKDKVESVFETFTQADMSTTRKYGGTGLGLAICKKLIEAMAGHIWIDSEHGKGSSFVFEITLLKGISVSDRNIHPLTIGELKGKTVAFVDDNERSRFILDNFCKDFELSVLFQADSAPSAWNKLDTCLTAGTLPEVILCDIMMPHVDGYMFSRKVKDNPQFQNIKIIAVSSDIKVGSASKAQSVGFDGFSYNWSSSELYDLLFDAIKYP
jgi:PAS domain S-box-containing protein